MALHVTPTAHTVEFDGSVVERGFWLYIWRTIPPTGEELLYVGRTGDSSSANAQSPLNRMGQHLGNAKNSSMLRNHLDQRGIEPQTCSFRLTAFGPLLPEAPDMRAHRVSRDVVAAMEKALADALRSSGYEVMNQVNSKTRLDPKRFAGVLAAFTEHFPRLSEQPLEGGPE